MPAKAGVLAETRAYGMMVHEGDSTAMEWMAKATVLSLTTQLKGRKIRVLDSFAATFETTFRAHPSPRETVFENAISRTRESAPQNRFSLVKGRSGTHCHRHYFVAWNEPT